MPITPSEFGSDHDSPYCSPRPMAHAEPVYIFGEASLTAEKTHTTSGVSQLLNDCTVTILTAYSADGHKIELLSGLSANGKKNTRTISNSNLQP